MTVSILIHFNSVKGIVGVSVVLMLQDQRIGVGKRFPAAVRDQMEMRALGEFIY